MAVKAVKEVEAPTETVDVDDLVAQLSKKNADYVFKLRRILTEHQWPEEKQRRTLAKLLPEMIDAQHQGKPANQLYGPVTEKAQSLVHAPKAQKRTNVWLSGLDLSLFFISVFALVYGVMTYMRPDQVSTGNGLLSLIVMASAAGFMFAYYNDWSRTPKAKRGKTWIVLLIGMVLIFAASAVSGALSMINTPLTQQMPWPGYAAVAVIGYGGHFWLKRRYNLKGIMAA
ncbi:DUF1129 domain-containing protein [Lacticaseibacillus daqingensis]|uniref:DUF1129 domain-containing protein n=1 Tax=Lacticaseibacillus daqingensis TaxID=2486014 RepID=UPI0013DE55E7|nr:DUF1129 family protein [Lacticaseibacillus daqingensis]